MKLPDKHQSGLEAEWHSVQPDEWNKYQAFADKHGEWATPSNLISTVGAASTATGLVLLGSSKSSEALSGVAAIGFGRTMDILDGYVASKTHTKSPTGEKVDAGIDTALIIGALAILMNNGTFPEAQGWATAAVTTAKISFTAIAKYKHAEIHTSRAGKLGTFGLWGAIGAYSIAKVADTMNQAGISHFSHLTGNAALSAGVLVSAIAANDYRKSAWPKKKS